MVPWSQQQQEVTCASIYCCSFLMGAISLTMISVFALMTLSLLVDPLIKACISYLILPLAWLVLDLSYFRSKIPWMKLGILTLSWIWKGRSIVLAGWKTLQSYTEVVWSEQSSCFLCIFWAQLFGYLCSHSCTSWIHPSGHPLSLSFTSELCSSKS